MNHGVLRRRGEPLGAASIWGSINWAVSLTRALDPFRARSTVDVSAAATGSHGTFAGWIMLWLRKPRRLPQTTSLLDAEFQIMLRELRYPPIRGSNGGEAATRSVTGSTLTEGHGTLKSTTQAALADVDEPVRTVDFTLGKRR